MVPMMSGTFSFDASGIAQIVSAPQWSKDTLDSVQTTLLHLQQVLLASGVPKEAAEHLSTEAEERLRAQNDVLATAIADKLQATPRSTKRQAIKEILDWVAKLKGLASSAQWAYDNILPIIEQITGL
jgi:hypothetical protein